MDDNRLDPPDHCDLSPPPNSPPAQTGKVTPMWTPTTFTVACFVLGMVWFNATTQMEAEGNEPSGLVYLIRDLLDLGLLAGVVAMVVIAARNRRARG